MNKANLLRQLRRLLWAPMRIALLWRLDVVRSTMLDESQKSLSMAQRRFELNHARITKGLTSCQEELESLAKSLNDSKEKMADLTNQAIQIDSRLRKLT